MKLNHYFRILSLTMLLAAVSVSCTSGTNKPIALASFTENEVEVSVSLERDANGKAFLAATYTPPAGHHLYSKDIPANGLDGLGRPTLLELTPGSRITALGGLIESVKAEQPDFEPKELLVYPVGPVTLRLPVQLPPGNDWIDDEIRITYMACSAFQCKPPVEGKIVQVRIPGIEVR